MQVDNSFIRSITNHHLLVYFLCKKKEEETTNLAPGSLKKIDSHGGMDLKNGDHDRCLFALEQQASAGRARTGSAKPWFQSNRSGRQASQAQGAGLD